MTRTSIGVASPDEAWADLQAAADTLLIDVRTQAEWQFVGAADLSDAAASAAYIEWAQLPAMAPNPSFADAAMQAVRQTKAARVYFICRSGARSAAAAGLMQQALAGHGMEVACINVAEGFEGDLDSQGRRGAMNGWKARGLPWRQS